MTSLTIKHLDDGLHDRTVEEETRVILHSGSAQGPQPAGLGDRIHRRFAALGGVELNLPPRTEQIRMVDLPG